ncbi:MAG: hypothetical protein PHH14_02270 [Candidatus Margulisbacteria bacterium]|nr:hypothetical protein [Candidatus Margulisiibacteriota bacterium]
MTHEEKANYCKWLVIDQIKEELACQDELLHCVDFEANPSLGISFHRQREALYKLGREGAFSIKPYAVAGMMESQASRYRLTINQPKLDELYKTYRDKVAKFEGIFKAEAISNDNKLVSRKISLRTKKVTFNDKTASIEIDDAICKLPPHKNEHYFCRVIFAYKPNRPIDWSIIYEKITGFYRKFFGRPANRREHWRTVYDAMEAINKRIKNKINTDDNLFSWQEKTVKRNF